VEEEAVGRLKVILVPLLLAFSSLTGYRSVVQAVDATPIAANAAICGAPGDRGLIAYVEPMLDEATPEAGQVRSALVVVATADGRQIHRTEVPDVPTLVPLGVGCALVANFGEGPPQLLDPVSGTLRKLVVPANGDQALYPAFWWHRTYAERRWAIVSTGRFDSGLLLDVQTGRLLDLTAAVARLRGETEPSVTAFFGATFTPDEASLLLQTDRDTWVVSPADPGRGRQISDAVVGRAVLSEDGRQILYLVRDAQKRVRVVVEGVNGSGRRTVTEGDIFSAVAWVPGSHNREALLSRDGSISLLDVERGTERRLARLPEGEVITNSPNFSPSGRQVLVRAGVDAPVWTWLDLDAATGRTLDALAGRIVPYGPTKPGMRWLTFMPSNEPKVEPGDTALGVDLQTGEVRALLRFDVTETYFGIAATTAIPSSPDGRFAVVNDLGTNYPRFWLLDAELGTARLFPGRIASAISPDGRSLLVGEQSGDGDPRHWRLLVMTVDGQDGPMLADGTARTGVWVPIPYEH
jgi:hypothetical protein